MPDLVELARPLLRATYESDLAADGAAEGVERELRALVAPGFETCMVLPTGQRNCLRGVEGFLELWGDWAGTFERFEMEEARPPAVGDGVLVNFVRQRGWLPESDVPIESEGSAAWFFEGERLARIEFHLRPEDALTAAGLPPDA